MFPRGLILSQILDNLIRVLLTTMGRSHGRQRLISEHRNSYAIFSAALIKQSERREFFLESTINLAKSRLVMRDINALLKADYKV